MSDIFGETWSKFSSHFNVDVEISEKWSNIIKSIYEGGVFYNLKFINLKLKFFQECSNLLNEPYGVFAAIIFQSICHDAKSSENFDNCKAKFEEFSKESGLLEKEPEFIAETLQLMELSVQNSTEEHNQPGGFGTMDKHFFIDIDFVHLAVEWDEYLEFSENSRKEYSFLSESAYKSLRLKVLQRFLLIPNIFATHLFRTKFEEKARENISREIESLK